MKTTISVHTWWAGEEERANTPTRSPHFVKGWPSISRKRQVRPEKRKIPLLKWTKPESHHIKQNESTLKSPGVRVWVERYKVRNVPSSTPGGQRRFSLYYVSVLKTDDPFLGWRTDTPRLDYVLRLKVRFRKRGERHSSFTLRTHKTDKRLTPNHRRDPPRIDGNVDEHQYIIR